MLVAFLILPSVFDAVAHTQSSYRWRNDDGTETTATYAAAENTTLGNIQRNSTKRVRFGAGNSGSESELLRKAATALHGGVNYIRTGVIDAANGYAYFGTNTSPGQVLKVALGSGSNEPALVATLTLNAGENSLPASAIDTVNGYAYFGTFTSPAQVIKVALGSGAAAPTRVGAVTLAGGENSLENASIDVANGYLYVATFTSPGIVVKVALGAGAAAPTRVGAVTLSGGENSLVSGAIDTTNGYYYVGTNTSPGIVVKVALGAGAAAPTRTAALALNSGENLLQGAVIDAANGYAYFGTDTSPGIVVKVALGAGAAAPTRTAALTLNSGENELVNSATIDTANGYAYFGTYTSPAIVVKVALGAGAAAPTRTAAVTLGSGENVIVSGVIDPTGGYAYFGTDTATGMVIKVALGAGAAAPTRTAVLPLTAINSVYSSVIDTVNGYAYFGTNTTPAKVIKVKLNAGDAAPTTIGAITMPTGENSLNSAAIDVPNGYAYFGTNTTPAKIVKIALGAGDLPPSRVGSVTLNSGEDTAISAVLDSGNGYAYFGTLTSPGRVVKVDLGVGNALPTRTGAVTLNSGENQLYVAATIDTTNGYAYFGTNTIPGIVVKVNLGAGAAAPTRTGAVTLSSGEDSLRGTAIDVANGYAYFTAATSPGPGRVVKVALGAGAAAPTRTGAVTLAAGENPVSAAIDTVNGFLYVGTQDAPAKVVKVALGAGAAAPTRSTAITMNGGEDVFYTAAIDAAHGYAYFPSYSPTSIVKVSTAPKSTFRLEYGTKVTTCAAIASWTQVPTTATTEHWAMSDSANITDGAVTTNSAGVTDGNTSFKAGEIHDTTSQTALYSLGEKEFTELEYSVKATSNATNSNYCLRLSNAGTALTTYTNYAEATLIPGPVITAISHSPASPTVAQTVTLSATATDTVGVTSMEIYLDGTAPANLMQTCNTGGASPASCSVNVGPLASGAHTTTVKAYNANGDITTGTDPFTVTSVGGSTCPTTGNNITIAASCTLAAGTYTYTGTLTIASGATVTTQGNTGAGTGVIINADNITVTGTISADVQGFTSGSGPGAGLNVNGGGGSGAGYGAAGGNGCCSGGGPAYGSVTQPTNLGSGGGGNNPATGGTGGGAIKLVSTGTVNVTGTVSANGGTFVSGLGGGGGSGGSIWIDGNTITGNGTVRANGAAGGGGAGIQAGGGGGGGRIAMYASVSTQTWTTQAFGGTTPGPGGGGYSQTGGGAGSIYLRNYSGSTDSLTISNNNNALGTTTQIAPSSQTYGSVTIKNGASYIIPNGFTLSATGTFSGGGTAVPTLTINSGGTLALGGTITFNTINVINNGAITSSGADVTITNGSLSGTGTYGAGINNLTIGSAGTFTESGATTLALTGTLTVQSGGTLTHAANSTTRANVVDISAASIDIQSGGNVTADSRGFTAANGTGAGASVSGGGSSGAGYGGTGGTGCCGNAGGAAYGSVKQPTDLGSGGGSESSPTLAGGTGGGAIKLVTTGTLNVSGTVSANGGNGSGGGAGGSIWLDGNSVTGNGTIRANGGSSIGNPNVEAGGGGSGGRIAMYSSASSQTWTKQAFGGAPANGGGSNFPTGGGAGTIYLRDYTGVTDSLTVANNNNAYISTTQVTTASQTYGAVTIKDGAAYIIPNTFTLSATGTFTGGGSSRPSLTINSGGTFSPPSANTTFTSIDVTNNGTIGTVTSLTLTSSTFIHNGTFSAGLANLTIGSSATFIISGLTTLAITGALTVQSGGTLTHTANTTTRANVVNISAASVDIQSGGTVTADSKGFSANTGTGAGTNFTGQGGAGAGYGGTGGVGCCSNAGGVAYGSVTQPTDIGSGGGNNIGLQAGGVGGGAIKIVSTGALNVSGTVTANGGGGSGGGSGGSIWLDGNSLTGNGTVRANGAASTGGINNLAGGGGSGGRIALYSTSSTQTWTKQTFGGAPDNGGGSNFPTGGGAGTIYARDYTGVTDSLTVANNNNAYAGTTQVTTASQTYGSVTVKDGAAYIIPNTFTLSATGTFTAGGTAVPSLTINSGGTLSLGGTDSFNTINVVNNGTLSGNGAGANITLTSGTLSGTGTYGTLLNNLTVGAAGTFTKSGTSTVTLSGALLVQSGGVITHTANTTSAAGKLHNLTITASTITVNAGGSINANGKGFASTEGTGQGTDGALAGGGGYGGTGGTGVPAGAAGGSSYGSSSNPVDLGSGGGVDTNTSAPGGAGGGEIRLTATTMTVNGTISASGTNGTANEAGAGSGGTIRLIVNATLSGSGTVFAQGGVGAGNNTTGGGCGGGGRIDIDFQTDTFSGTRTANADPSCTVPRSGTNGSVTLNQLANVGVTSPNGGESYAGGALSTITWTAIGSIDHFRITLSTDSGATYPTVVTNSTASSPYAWTVNNITTSLARIKVEAMDGSNVVLATDTSNADFSITATAVTVTAPNGGESLSGGQLFNVAWTSAGIIDHFRITLSTNSGGSFLTTVATTTASSPYSWTVPNITTTTARIKVEAMDAGNAVLISDMSNADFSITTTSISVTTPNGGETIVVGGTLNVSWTSGGTIDHFRITYSEDGGVTYPTLVTASTPSSPYAWTAPSTTTTQGRIKVEALDNTNTVLNSDISDGDFTVRAASGGGGGGGDGGGGGSSSNIFLNSPDGGGQVNVGDTLNVTWSYEGTDIQTVDVLVSMDSGATYAHIATDLSPSSQHFAWVVEAATTTTQARIRINAMSANHTLIATDASASDFTIIGPDMPPEPNPATDPVSVLYVRPTVIALAFNPNEESSHPSRVYGIQDELTGLWVVPANSVNTATFRLAAAGDEGYVFSTTPTYMSIDDWGLVVRIEGLSPNTQYDIKVFQKPTPSGQPSALWTSEITTPFSFAEFEVRKDLLSVVPASGGASIYLFKLTITNVGTQLATNITLADQIPDGATYVAGSLTVDGRTLTDAHDGDEGWYQSDVAEARWFWSSLDSGFAHQVTVKMNVPQGFEISNATHLQVPILPELVDISHAPELPAPNVDAVTLSATAKDDNGIVEMDVYLDDVRKKVCVFPTPQAQATCNVDVGALPYPFITTRHVTSVRAFNKEGSAVSGSESWTMSNPPPILTSVSPSVIVVGSGAQPITVSGQDLLPSTVARWEGSARSRSTGGPASQTGFTFQALASDVDQVGLYNVTLFTPGPGGGTSSALQVRVVQTPVIKTVTHAPAIPAIGGNVDVTATASESLDGVSKITLAVDGALVKTCTFAPSVKDASCTGSFTVLAYGTHTTTATAYNIWDMSASGQETWKTENPVPTLSQVAPNVLGVGSGDTVVNLIGTNIIPESIGRWEGHNLARGFQGSPSKTNFPVVIPASYLATIGTFDVTIFNPGPGGGTSEVRQVNVVAAPVVTSVTHAPEFPEKNGTVNLHGTATDTEGGVTRMEISIDGHFVKACNFAPAETPATCDATYSPVAIGSHTTNVVAFNKWNVIGSASEGWRTQNPVPVLTSVSPALLTVGSPDTSINAIGHDFVAESVVRWEGSDRARANQDKPTETVIPFRATAADLSAPGLFNVTVFSPGPGGGTSEARQVRVVYAPTVTSVIHTPEFPERDASALLTATATDQEGGVTKMDVSVDGRLLKTCTFSPAKTPATCSVTMGAIVLGSHVTTAVAYNKWGVTGSGTEGWRTSNPVPVLDSVAPDLIAVGSKSASAAVIGRDFVPESIVLWDGAARERTTTSADTTTFSFRMLDSDLLAPGLHDISVFSPAPGGGTSESRQIRVAYPPTVTVVTHADQIPKVGDTVTLTATATDREGGVTKLEVTLDGAVLKTCTFPVPSTPATCSVETSSITYGAHSTGATAYNVLGLSGSNSESWRTENVVPVLSSVSPLLVASHSPNTQFEITGRFFVPETVARWNGAVRPNGTSNRSDTRMSFIASAADLVRPGVFRVTVFNPAPGGGESNVVSVRVVDAPVITNVSFDPTYPQQKEIVSLHAEASDTDSLASMTVSIDGSVRGDCRFDEGIKTGECDGFSLPVDAGDHTVTAVVTNIWGLTATDSTTFRVNASYFLKIGNQLVKPGEGEDPVIVLPPEDGGPSGPGSPGQPGTSPPAGANPPPGMEAPYATGSAAPGSSIIVYVDGEPYAVVLGWSDGRFYIPIDSFMFGKKVTYKVVPAVLDKAVPASELSVPIAIANVAALATSANAFSFFIFLITEPALLFNRRKRRGYGTVFDSLRRLPVSLATVRLIDTKTGRVVATRVTDTLGRYVLFANPGTYRVEVAKPGYIFPSAFMAGREHDVAYADLLTSTQVEFKEEKQVRYNIPIDPGEAPNHTPFQIRLRQWFRVAQHAVAVAGPVFALYAVLVAPSPITISIFIAQVLLYAIFLRLAYRRRTRGAGAVRDKDGNAIRGAVVRIFDARWNRLLETQLTGLRGRYGFLVGQNQYYVTVTAPGHAPYTSGIIDIKDATGGIVTQDIVLP